MLIRPPSISKWIKRLKNIRRSFSTEFFVDKDILIDKCPPSGSLILIKNSDYINIPCIVKKFARGAIITVFPNGNYIWVKLLLLYAR